MVRYALLFDTERCIKCYSCEVACKQEHNLPAGQRWIRAMSKGPLEVGGKLYTKFIPVTCMHCGKAPCMEVCPAKAITQRTDGIVLINADLCIGCKLCIQACPFGAPQFNPKKGVVEKCNLCVERVDRGRKPACVQNCYSQAIHFGDINELTKVNREKILRFWFHSGLGGKGE